MSDKPVIQLPPLLPFSPFTFADLEQIETASNRLRVERAQIWLRRFTMYLDFFDDATPVTGLTDFVITIPVIAAGIIGALEQALRLNWRGILAEVIGSALEAIITAVPYWELLDPLFFLFLGKRTPTQAREWAESTIKSKTPRKWFVVSRGRQHCRFQGSSTGYMVHCYEGSESHVPRHYVYYQPNNVQWVWDVHNPSWQPADKFLSN